MRKHQPRERGRALAELRRSCAAGLHGKHRKDRANTKRRAILAERGS